MNQPLQIALFGLGSMGYGMGESLLRTGHLTCGADVNANAITRFRADGRASESPANLAASVDAVVVVVLNAEQTESVLFGQDALVSTLKPGCVVIASATMAPSTARDFEERCKAHGVHYLDAPISGGSVKAADGALTVMASGTPAAFRAARPVLENRAPHIVAGDYTAHSAVDIWPKDLGIVTDIAREAGFSAPLAAAALQQFISAASSGLGREDDAAVAKIYAQSACITLPGPAAT